MIIRRITGWPTWELRSPFEELERMRSQMNRFAEELTEGLYREPTAGVFPLLNVTEDKDKYYVRAELPGIKANDLDISVMGNTLSISGERKISAEGAKEAYVLREYRTGTYFRQFTLSEVIDQGKIDAEMNDGVLRLVLPKVEPAKPRKITVKVD